MAGRPTTYRPNFCVQVEKLCKLGATDDEIANFFEVQESTINNWKLAHPEFLESIKKGKVLADAEVAHKLFKRATGYSHPEVDIKVISGEIVTTELIKHYPPDTAAAIFWLKNRRKKEWRDKIETGFTDGEGNDSPITIFQLPDNGRNATKDNQAAGGLSNENA
jgi:hypothetical protein